ncbi:tripartite tricarboxylate transporter substrate binding protein [Bordetella bronchiseptica]|uniref:tripartite tricarboxylate transporter substrate binding protein n=1 Tax=Bordetella bronchiseptica TaxID=518 RepID=UPI00028F58AF|nr:tripartite tricarboxylate transporter substrate binding protein [Bordetella bronchiseptica]KAK73145.1 tripartite tricarboxylate transporter family receptor [Bordetella bronchiseptica MO211]CCN17916.1 putative exported protein flags: precursor [Bordetella bronchiseptica MO211]
MHAFCPSRRRATLALLSLPAWAGLPAAAAPGYPAKPIAVLVSLQAGSASDFASRRVAEHMAAGLNAPMVVENAPGAGGLIGASKLFNTQADGYAIGALNNGLICIVPNLKNKPAFDIARLTPIGMVAWLPSVLVVSAALPARTLAELTALSRARPGSLSYGSVGVGSPQHLAMEMLKQSTGLDLLHVPYRGGPQSVADVVAGQIAATWIAIPVAAPFIKSGQLKAIAVGSTARSSELPTVPTLAESGVTDFTYLPWIGFFGPPGLPPSITAALHGALQQALRDHGVSAGLAAAGLEAAPMGAAEFARRCETERREMAAVLDQLDLV